MAVMCNQLIADFLQLGQRIFHKGNIAPRSRKTKSSDALALRCFAFDFVHKPRQLLMVQRTTTAQFY